MIVEHMPKGSNGALGSPGIDEIRWKKPVFPGMICVCGRRSLMKPSRSRADMGTIFMLNELFNQTMR